MSAYVAGRSVGFLSLKRHSAYSSEINCMGIVPEWHHRGIGTALIGICQEICQQQGTEFLTVKTLDESRLSEAYEQARRFYLARGFRPLEVFPTLWGEGNPCVFMVKYLGSAARGYKYRMHAKDSIDKNYWIHRMMVDRKYRGRGLGGTAPGTGRKGYG